MGARAIGDVSEDLLPVLQLNPVHAVGKRLDDDPLHEMGALGHEPRLYQTRKRPQANAPAPSPGRARDLPPNGADVSTTGPFSVIATVCSK